MNQLSFGQRAVHGDGPTNAKIMIVGEAPGAEEEIKGKPFIGTSGMEMDRMLAAAGIFRAECFVTNVCRIRPPNNDILQYILTDKSGKPIVNTRKTKTDTTGYVKYRDLWVKPPILEGIDYLKKEIQLVKPNIIIAFGNVAMWALTGKRVITKWRGSMLYADQHIYPRPACMEHIFQFDPLCPSCTDQAKIIKVIPSIHPAAVLREWSMRGAVVTDLRRAARFKNGEPYPDPGWKFIINPSFSQVRETLDMLLSLLENTRETVDRGFIPLSVDIETQKGYIDCVGIAWNKKEAICIPFMCSRNKEGFWTLEEEVWICWMLYRILTHPRVRVIGQNFLYDAQYFWRGLIFSPKVGQDTMIAQHSIFADAPKALFFQASMYCDYYVYWKDEGKHKGKNISDEEHWRYNCQDLVYTLECAETHEYTIHEFLNKKDQAGNTSPTAWPSIRKVFDFQQQMFWPVLKAMQRGIRVDPQVKADLVLEVEDELARRNQFLIDVIGHPLNPKSNGPNGQMQKFFYQDLGQPVIMTRAKKGQPSRPTLNDDALQTIGLREPLLKPILNCIADIRTLGIFLSAFLLKPLDVDDRMRCSWNIGGSESGKSAPRTYRLSSSENAFGSGGNLQNIPSEKSKSVGKSAARNKGAISILGDPVHLPNLRSMFIPDPGYTFFDGDLDRADLQVVVYEADDKMLKEALKKGVDIHLLNAFVVRGKEPPPLDELIERHKKDGTCTCPPPKCYWDHRLPLYLDREFAKVFCHATNYVGSARTVATHTGRTVHEIDRAQKIWFGAHPGIKALHTRTENQIAKYRFVENRFGYRWYIFDRLDAILPEAVAWIPQSTVSIVINKIWMNFHEKLPEVEILLQIHDALAGQVPTAQKNILLPKMQECGKIVIPYEDPLVIPFSIKTSEKSWGDCA